MEDQQSGEAELRVRDIGEFGLIDRLASIVGQSPAVVGIGDDAAVLDVGGPDYLLATMDALVDGIHFRLDRHPPRAIGRRAMAVNISDVAAMGGQPLFALASLALPPNMPLAEIESLYEGMRDLGKRCNTAIVGGNVTRNPGPLVLDIALLGRVPRDEAVTRNGARPGDLLAVTGTLGTRAAIRLAEEDGFDLERLRGWAAEAYVPEPQVAAGRALAAGHLVHAMMDLSDGLAGDIRHLCVASGVGAVIDEADLPISDEVQEIASILGSDAAEIALTGGEDYELLCALPAAALIAARRALGPLPFTPIGRITEPDEGITLIGRGGHRRPLIQRSWEHF